MLVNNRMAEFLSVRGVETNGEVSTPTVVSLGVIGVRLSSLTTESVSVQNAGLLYQATATLTFDGNLLSERVKPGDRVVVRKFGEETTERYRIMNVEYDDFGFCRAYIREWSE